MDNIHMPELTEQQIANMLSILRKNQDWGTYHVGKFYFTIATGISRTQVGLTENVTELSAENQQALQHQHFPALFHEYMHYLHELSTVIGNASSMLSIVQRSMFSHHFDTDLGSCVNHGMMNTPQMLTYAKMLVTQQVINGDSDEVLNGGKTVQILNIEYVKKEVYFPLGEGIEEGKIEIPRVSFSYFNTGFRNDGKLDFGKYFIYEGIAYELDQIVEKNVLQLATIKDSLRNTEYTVLRKIAHFIYPGISTRTFITLATLSLQFIDCGATFISFVQRVNAEIGMGILEETIIEGLKQETSQLLSSKQNDFNEAQDEVVATFQQRESLHNAYSYIANQSKNLYQKRIESPAFEVDLVFENRQWEILDIASICNYMYLFKDEEEFMRDFLGTSIDQETAKSLQVLLSYADYFSAHQIYDTAKVEEKPHCCPFYYCCPLSLRKDFPDICKTKPWRIFEQSYSTNKQYCWYGNGVGEFKGHTNYNQDSFNAVS